MSREIKFRAWHKNANHMCKNATTDLLDRDYLEFMQYTGMKDKNGKEIYESDLVKNSSGRLMEVVWFESPSFCGWDLRARNNKGNPPKENSLWDDLEIVGNIYENPELLEC